MSVNKVILLGRLGKDPELKVTQNQTAICNFSLATSERRKDASGTWTEQTEWHNVICFGKTAENCSKYLTKGKEIFLEGRIQTRKWQDKEGKDRYSTEIIANSITFVGGKSEAKESNGNLLDSLPSASSEPVPFDDDDIPF